MKILFKRLLIQVLVSLCFFVFIMVTMMGLEKVFEAYDRVQETKSKVSTVVEFYSVGSSSSEYVKFRDEKKRVRIISVCYDGEEYEIVDDRGNLRKVGKCGE